MANSFAIPSAVLGLMGRRPQTGRSLLDFINPMQADALDEQMFAAAPNGYVESPEGMYFPADQNAQAAARQQMQAAPQNAMPQREKVSGWRVLDRVLGGETITGGLDAERARLQAEAMRPQMMEQAQENERIARALGPQALLALRTNGAALGEGLAAQYKPTTTGAGGISTVFGTGQQVEAPRVLEFGNDLVQAGPLSGTRTLATRGPSYAEQAQMNRIDREAANDASRLELDYQRLGQDQAQFDQRLNFDESRQIARPLSASDQKAVDAAEQNLVRVGSSIDRARQIQAQITGGQLNLGPIANTISGARNALGQSNENSLNYDALLAWAKSARNAALSANTGVQTDQDAIRELDTILSGTKDERVVMAALQRYIDYNTLTQQALQSGIERRLGGRGAPQGASSAPPPPTGFVLD